MNPRKTTESRSAFYRGISLKEYLRKSSQMDEPLNYKDDETIFYDQNHLPLVVADDFIFSESRHDTRGLCDNFSARVPTQSYRPSNIGLPMLKTKKVGISKLKSFLTDRHSTDASLPNGCEVRQRCLPSLDPNQPIDQISPLLSQLIQSRQSSRPRPSPMARQKSDASHPSPSPNLRSISNRKYVELIRHQMQMKQRCKVSEPKASKKPYMERYKSHNE